MLCREMSPMPTRPFYFWAAIARFGFLRHFVFCAARRFRASCQRMRTLVNYVVLAAGTLSAQSFLAPLNVPAGNAPSGIVTGDFNRDGKPDIIVSNSGSSNISVFLGIGNGSFRSRRDFVAGSQPQALASGDFNGDGKLDLAVVSQTSNSVLILLGNGDEHFFLRSLRKWQAPRRWPLPTSMATANSI